MRLYTEPQITLIHSLTLQPHATSLMPLSKLTLQHVHTQGPSERRQTGGRLRPCNETWLLKGEQSHGAATSSLRPSSETDEMNGGIWGEWRQVKQARENLQCWFKEIQNGKMKGSHEKSVLNRSGRKRGRLRAKMRWRWTGKSKI